MSHPIVWKPMPHQAAALKDSSQYVGLIGGYGCGKTNWLVHKMLMLASENHGMQGGLLAPSLKQFKRDFLPELRNVCYENKIRMKFDRELASIKIPQIESEILVFHDEDKGDSIQGPNLAFGCVNEVTLVSKEGFDAFDARIRLKKSRKLQLAFSGTPDIMAWVYEEFEERGRENSKIYKGRTQDNLFLHESYYKRLYDAFDPQMRAQYLNGEWVSLSGNRAAWAYEPEKHLQDLGLSLTDRDVWVSLDFNVDPMSATLWLRGNVDDPWKLYAYDNIKLDNSNTYKLAETIIALVGNEVALFPDPAGKHRSTTTQTDVTDIRILRSAPYCFEDIRYKLKIKSVKRCLMAMNQLFSKGEILIHPRCKELRKDLDQCKLDSTGTVLDKSDSKRTHWLDGLKNMCDFEFPLIETEGVAKVWQRGKLY